MSTQRYELHRFCKAFRRANAGERGEIVASMRGYGYDGEQPITLYEGMILDGATRQDAAEEAGVAPTFTTFTGSEDEAIAFVIRRNRARKHMTQGELVLAGARLVTAKKGAPRGNQNRTPSKGSPETPLKVHSDVKTRAMVGTELGRSPGTIKKARELLHRGTDHIISMVEAGEVGISTATDAIRGKTQEQQAQMTATDIRRAANAYKTKPPKHERVSKPPPTPKSPPRPHTDFTKLDIGDERIFGQPVQLWPARVQRLQEAAIRVMGVATRVESLAKVDTKGCTDDLERLLAYQPVAGKKNGEERDFAKEARKSLATIEKHIEKAINRLVELRAVIANRAKEKAS
jgi:hypothetical protein